MAGPGERMRVLYGAPCTRAVYWTSVYGQIDKERFTAQQLKWTYLRRVDRVTRRVHRSRASAYRDVTVSQQDRSHADDKILVSVPRPNLLAPSQGQNFGLDFDAEAKISASAGFYAKILVSVSVLVSILDKTDR